jgi:hypothetical protein
MTMKLHLSARCLEESPSPAAPSAITELAAQFNQWRRLSSTYQKAQIDPSGAHATQIDALPCYLAARNQPNRI